MRLAFGHLDTARRSLARVVPQSAIGCARRPFGARRCASGCSAAGHYLLETPAFVQEVAHKLPRLCRSQWPQPKSHCVAPITRRVGPKPPRGHFVAKLAARVDRATDNGAGRSYHALLDHILLDREISLHRSSGVDHIGGRHGQPAREDARSDSIAAILKHWSHLPATTVSSPPTNATNCCLCALAGYRGFRLSRICWMARICHGHSRGPSDSEVVLRAPRGRRNHLYWRRTGCRTRRTESRCRRTGARQQAPSPGHTTCRGSRSRQPERKSAIGTRARHPIVGFATCFRLIEMLSRWEKLRMNEDMGRLRGAARSSKNARYQSRRCREFACRSLSFRSSISPTSQNAVPRCTNWQLRRGVL